MASTRDNQLWVLVRAERAALADDLSGLSDQKWRHGTPCGQWDVEEVVAHLTRRGKPQPVAMGTKHARRAFSRRRAQPTPAK